MNNENRNVSRKIAEYAFSLDYNDLPPEVIHEVKRRVLDSFACALGAFTSIPGQIARNMGQQVQCDYGATIFGTENRTTPELATFANGILFRYLDYNDTYLSKEPAHPSDNIPAAIAVAEAEGGSGRDLITAIVLGYEIQCRFCDSASLRSGGWDHVGYVSISSPVLASRLMNMELEKIEHAIALSIAPNIPLRQTRVGELSMWKGAAAANAARNGVFAALLAKWGMTGPCEIFEGEKGFFKQVTGPFDLKVEGFGGKGVNFKILDTYIKYYPSEYHSQAGVEAALSLRDKVESEDIEEINIETYDACVDIIAGDKEKWIPKTKETADHSLPYCIAVALCDGTVGLGQFTDERIKDPDLQKIMSKIKVMRNPEHDKQYPEAFPCLIEIKSKSGETFTKTVTYPKGHPKNALTDSELEEKFNILDSGLIKDNTLKEIIDNIWRLESLTDIGCFMKLFKVDTSIY